MFLFNRVASSRKASREFNSVLTNLDPNSAADMENTFIAPLPALRRKRAVTEVKRHSRMPSLFFGNGGNKVEESVEDISSRPSSRVSIVEPESSRFFFSTRRKLKKSASKASLSMASPPILESPRESDFEGNTRTKARSPIGLSSPPRKVSDKFIHPISEPYNFNHVTHAAKNDYPHVRTGSSVKPASPASPSSRNSRLWRPRSNSTVSPAESLLDLPIMRSQESLKSSSPMPPPPRMSSRQALNLNISASNDIQEEFVDPASIGIATTPADEPEEFIARAITTEGDFTMGSKSPGITKLFFDASKMFPEPPQMEEVSQEESTVPVARPDSPVELRKASSTPDMSNAVRDTRRQRSNTLSGRHSPLSRRSSVTKRRSVSGRRFSFKLSPAATPERCLSGIESWEDVIDYSYSQEAECTFDYEWDQSSAYSDSFYEMTESFDSQASFDEIPTPLGAIDEEVHRPSLHALTTGRLTGLFEDKLLLPGTPLSARFPECPLDIGIADGGYDLPHVENTDIILRAADTTLRHRSMKSTSSLQDLVPAARVYREELSRYTRQLDNHLATIGAEKRKSKMLPHNLTVPQRFGSRPRTDSNATCATMCSDNELSPCESAEIITPPLSTHSSYDILYSKDGVFYPKSTKEFAPTDVHVVGFEEDEVQLNLF